MVTYNWNETWSYSESRDEAMERLKKFLQGKAHDVVVFRCVLASLYEGLSVCRPVRPSVGPFVPPWVRYLFSSEYAKTRDGREEG